MARRLVLVAALALGVASFGGTSNAGCVEDALSTPSPGLNGTVKFNPDGTVTVDPYRAVGVANAATGAAYTFADCVV